MSLSVSRGSFICCSTSSCSSGSMFARKTYGQARCSSWSRGWNVEKTFSWVSSVCAWASSGAVLAPPAEGAPGGGLQPREVHAAALEQRAVLRGEVLAHHGDDAHRSELARREREIRSRAAQRLDRLAVGRAHRVEGDRAHHQDLGPGAHAGTSVARSMRSGADTPISASPFASTVRAAPASRSRPRVTASSSPTTRQA